MPDLPDKLASAKEGSRELDAEIDAAITGWHPAHLCHDTTRRGYGTGFMHRLDDGSNLFIADGRNSKPYTTSLDAIVSLIGEKLPANGGIDLFVRKGVSTAVIYHSEDGDGEWKASGKTIGLAACRALLRALQKGNAHD